MQLVAEASWDECGELLFYEVLHFRQIEDFDECIETRIVHFIGPRGETQHETVINCVVDDQCSFRITASRDQIRSIDQGKCNVIKGMIGLRRI